MVVAAVAVSGCGPRGLVKHNRSQGVFSAEQIHTNYDWLYETTDDWHLQVVYAEGKLPGASALAGFPLGNGKVFALTGLKYPLGTLENIFGPTYQREPGSFGQIVPAVYVGPEPAQWERQETTWIRPGGIVKTVSVTADGLALTLYDFAPPDLPVLVRVAILYNQNADRALGPLSLCHAFTAITAAEEGGEIHLERATQGLRCGYLDSQAVTGEGFALPYDPEQVDRSTRPALHEEATLSYRCPLGQLGPKQSLTKLFYLVFTDETDDGDQTLQTIRERGPELLEMTHQYWQQRARKTVQVRLADRRLSDFLAIEKYLVQVQQAERGGFSPMHGYTKVWIRDSNGPVRYLLACGDYAAVRRYLDYQFRGYAQQGTVSNNLALNLDLAETVEQPAWESVQVPAAEIASFIILQRYWYWQHTADHELIQQQWPMLRRCLWGQQVDEQGALPFFGDETYRFPGYERFKAGKPALYYVNMLTRSLDSALEYVAAAEAMAEMAPLAGFEKEASKYAAVARQVRQAAQKLFWREEGGRWVPARSDLTDEVQRSPFAAINFRPLWLNDTVTAQEVSNVRQTLKYLAKPNGSVYTTPDFGYYVPMTLGYSLYNLSAIGHPARDYALTALLNAAEASGGFAEMNTPEDRPSAEIWGQHRFRPWEGGLNAEAVLYALSGMRVNVPQRRLRLRPWLPENTEGFVLTPLIAGDFRFRLDFSANECRLSRTDEADQEPVVVDLHFVTAGPVPQVSGNWKELGGRLETRAVSFSQKDVRLLRVQLRPHQQLGIKFKPALQPARGKMPPREPFVWGPARPERLKPVVLLTWDRQTAAEQRSKYGAELSAVDTKISWPLEYLRSYLFAPDGSPRARRLVTDVARFAGAFKPHDFWTQGEGAKLLAEFEQAGGEVIRLNTGRDPSAADIVPDI